MADRYILKLTVYSPALVHGEIWSDSLVWSGSRKFLLLYFPSYEVFPLPQMMYLRTSMLASSKHPMYAARDSGVGHLPYVGPSSFVPHSSQNDSWRLRAQRRVGRGVRASHYVGIVIFKVRVVQALVVFTLGQSLLYFCVHRWSLRRTFPGRLDYGSSEERLPSIPTHPLDRFSSVV